ncbi:MAG: hypothetical protein ACM3QU_10255 [Verrucomicrobiota bacterium]
MSTAGGSSVGLEALEEVARHFHEHEIHDPPDRIAALICEDAEMVLLVNHLRPLRGKHAILDALVRGRAAEIYSAWIDRTQWLDEDTLLLSGNARYAPDETSLSVSRVWWIDAFRDGCLWRVHAFLKEDDARNAYAHGRAEEIGADAG